MNQLFSSKQDKLLLFEEIYELDQSIFAEQAWNNLYWQKALEHPHHFILLSRLASSSNAFLIFTKVWEDSEVLKIGVLPNSKREGIGKSLMKDMFEDLKRSKADKSVLEVREDNFAAIRFYEALGYNQISVRKNYYSKPAGNALVLKKDLSCL